MRTYLALLLLFAACADPPSGPAPLECAGPSTTRAFRIDRVTVPDDTDEVDQLGFDLDGDDSPDNQAGNILVAIYRVYPDIVESLQDRLDRRFSNDAVWLVEVETCGGDGDARVSLARGALDDAGRIYVVERGDEPAAGRLFSGRLVAELGTGQIPVGVIADLADAAETDGWHATDPLTFDLVVDGTALFGRVGGGLEPGYDVIIAEAFRPYIQMRLDSGNTEWGTTADIDGDGTLSVEELLVNPLFSVLMHPDVDADHDGTNESLSFGFGISAIALD